jgi:hypothetical protein
LDIATLWEEINDDPVWVCCVVQGVSKWLIYELLDNVFHPAQDYIKEPPFRSMQLLPSQGSNAGSRNQLSELATIRHPVASTLNAVVLLSPLGEGQPVQISSILL